MAVRWPAAVPRWREGRAASPAGNVRAAVGCARVAGLRLRQRHACRKYAADLAGFLGYPIFFFFQKFATKTAVGECFFLGGSKSPIKRLCTKIGLLLEMLICTMYLPSCLSLCFVYFF